MKNIYIWILLAILFVLPIKIHAQVVLQPIRTLTVDTLNKTLYLDSTAPNRDGKMYEFVDGARIKNFKIKYEKKGSSRGICEPPPLNISFDKFDGQGRPKELFTGLSTDAGNTQLQYQKIRMIPDCDVWNEYFSFEGDVGFSGQANVLLREYVISKIFRFFGIPTADMLGIANVTFVSTDPKLNNKTFRYLIIQRPSELDDQIPFTTQFGLDPDLYESGISNWGVLHNDNKRLAYVNLQNNITGQRVKLDFDQNTALKFSLLTDFLNLSDMSYLHNEDYGVSLANSKTFIIPHGFDLSFTCYMQEPDNNQTYSNITDLPTSLHQSYKTAYFQVARSIFGSQNSLANMLALVDGYADPSIDRSKLKEFIKIRFYQYAKYFNSAEFASAMNQAFVPLNLNLPFSSDQEYENHKDTFNTSCYRSPRDLDVGVTVSNPSLSLEDRPGFTSKILVGRFTMNIQTNEIPLQLSKFSGIFDVILKNQNNDTEQRLYGQRNISIVSGVEDIAGPFYIIPANTNAQFVLSYEERASVLLESDYSMRLASFTPNGNFKPLQINSITNTVHAGILSPIVINNPQTGSELIDGTEIDISWSGIQNRSTYISVQSALGDIWSKLYISDPNIDRIFPGNTFRWTVGKYYNYSRVLNRWVSEDLPLGQYKIIVRDSESNIEGESGVFDIVGNNNRTHINVTAPNNGETWNMGSTKSIRWSYLDADASGGASIKKVQISITPLVTVACPKGFECGQHDTTIASKIDVNRQNYSWNVGNNINNTVLPDGSYRIKVCFQGTTICDSSDVPINIKRSIEITTKSVVKIVGKPIITMTLNKVTNNEEVLRTMFDVSISAGDTDRKIPKSGAFQTYVKSSTGSTWGGSIEYLKPANVIMSSDNEYYILKKGMTAIFRVITSINPKIMFAGEYQGLLERVWFVSNDDTHSWHDVELNPKNTVNKLLIIGEKSPYIESISPDGVPMNTEAIISGVRFNTKQNRLNITSVENKEDTVSRYVRSEDGKTIKFIPNVDPGAYYINIDDYQYGKSNSIYLRVKPPIAAPQTPVIKRPMIEYIMLPDTIEPIEKESPMYNSNTNRENLEIFNFDYKSMFANALFGIKGLFGN